MTEQEARTKWCPMTRVLSTNWKHGCGFNRITDDTAKIQGPATGSFCLASDCMMWRWKEKSSPNDPNRRGHCGLGGKP